MEFPKRSDQHISETESFKLFSKYVPGRWVIREITERDYGIDCYVEIVNEKKELTGELVSIQLKSISNGIDWTLDDYVSISVKPSTTNYWNHFPVPVFIILTDIKNDEVFFQSVKKSVIENYSSYKAEKLKSHKIHKINELSQKNGFKLLEKEYLIAKNRERFEKTALTFITHIYNYNDFITRHWGLDFHIGIESDDMVYLKSLYHNYQFLCEYLKINWTVTHYNVKIKEYKTQFKETYGYELIEHYLSQLVQELNPYSSKIMESLKELVNDEFEYWIRENISLVNYVSNFNLSQLD